MNPRSHPSPYIRSDTRIVHGRVTLLTAVIEWAGGTRRMVNDATALVVVEVAAVDANEGVPLLRTVFRHRESASITANRPPDPIGYFFT